MNNGPVKTVVVQQGFPHTGPLTIYPAYSYSTVTVTEIVPVSSEKYLYNIISWWNIRPCKYCKKVFSKHNEYTRGCGEFEENSNLFWKTSYEPMDALSFIEHLAKEKGLV